MHRRPFRYQPARSSKALVPRRRLLDLLSRRFEVPLSLVIGGAGFGKSRLLEQMLAEDSRRDADQLWLGCEAGDSSADHLAGGLAAVLGLSLDSPPVVETLVTEIWHRAPRRVLLILDDVHRIDRDSSGMAVLKELVTELPSNGHLLLASRVELPLALQRMRVADQLVQIDEEMLAFDALEAAAFSELRGVRSGLSTATWPALAELEAEVGLRGAFRYVAEEVLDQLDPKRRSVLAALAIHGEVDDGLAARLGVADGQVDEWVLGLPLTSRLPDGRIHLHDLWRDFLANDLTPNERRAALTALAAELAERGDLSRAFGYYREIADEAGMISVIESLARDFEMALGRETWIDVLDTIPSYLEEDARVELVRAVWQFHADPLAAQPDLNRTAEALRKAELPEFETIALFYLFDLAQRQDLGEIRKLRDRAEVLAEGGITEATALVALAEAWVLLLTGSTHEVLERLRDPALLRSRYAAGPVAFVTISAHYERGDFRRALDEAERLPDDAWGRSRSMLAGRLMMCRWHLGLIDSEVLAQSAGMLDEMERAGHTHIAVQGTGAFAKFHASCGDLAGAQFYLNRCERDLTPDAPDWLVVSHALAAATLDVLEGREAAAATRLRGLLRGRTPTGAGVMRSLLGRSLAIIYALVPESREEWDADDLGPEYLRGRGVGRALVALRERGDLEAARDLEWRRPELLRSWAFEPHLLELALAAAAAGAREALDVLPTLQTDLRAQLEALTCHAHQDVRRMAAEVRRITPVPPQRPVRVELFGGLRLMRGDEPVRDPHWKRRSRVRSLLAILATRKRVRRAEIADILWPGKSEEAGLNNLRVTLSYLLRIMEPERERGAPSWFVENEPEVSRTTACHLALA